MRLEELTQRFWAASLFLRRSQDRNTEGAHGVLDHVLRHSTGRLYEQAEETKRKICDGERASN